MYYKKSDSHKDTHIKYDISEVCQKQKKLPYEVNVLFISTNIAQSLISIMVINSLYFFL